ncbi:MAG: hypothetical protein KY433_02745, partial [Actinobacteria bacterium]|nr:hypothetical protein [Actinomycetota bacterium]
MADVDASFVVARNPETDSTLPFLLRLPLDGGILLKARERWPTTARVYCHPLEQWPADAEILERVAVRAVPAPRGRDRSRAGPRAREPLADRLHPADRGPS